MSANIAWTNPTAWGNMQISINLTKPEKDPWAIAAAATNPTCVLCDQNQTEDGWLPAFAASARAAQPNLRLGEVDLDGCRWYVQYSPYHYFNQHCIAANEHHIPMHIDTQTFDRLLALVDAFPGFFMGSNADLPIVGGSILAHDHFQGGVHDFPMDAASVVKPFSLPDFPQVKCGIIKWPLTVVRLQAASRDQLVAAAGSILDCWKGYSDARVGVVAATDGVPHNTITPIARKVGDAYRLDLALRCNVTSEEHPLGVFHPHEHLHHIKKENIGLIEVMGLAILPARLRDELEQVARSLVEGVAVEGPHAAWAAQIASQYPQLSADNVNAVLRDEVAKAFSQVLECAGVLKTTAAQDRFLEALGVSL